MKKNNRTLNFNKTKKIKTLIYNMIIWVLFFMVFSLLRSLGVENLGPIKSSYVDKMRLILILGSFIGFLSGLYQVFLEEKLHEKLLFPQIIGVRIVLILALSFVFFIGAFFYFKNVTDPSLKLETILTNPGTLSFVLFILLTDSLLTFGRKVSLLLGEKTLANLLMGKYHLPQKEERIFMFLDLKSSTTIAEKLGFEKYSNFIQDCFNDLGIVMNRQANIYQYIGDEAVLTWNLVDGLSNQNCLRAFFEFRNELKRKNTYYIDSYGIAPTFKAGLHLGTVMVAEVGKYKKEIAYHGDTINTAARIQQECNTRMVDLLISEALKKSLNESNINFLPLGATILKGKESETILYAVEEHTNE